MDLRQLDPYQYDMTVKAMMHAYPDYNELKILMRKMGKQLSMYATNSDGGLTIVLDNLIEKATSQGFLEELLVGAIKFNPNNPLLRELAPVLALTSTGAPMEQLQAMVLGNNGLIDIGDWKDGIDRAGSAVCRIQIVDNSDHDKKKGVGTGFLVADDVLMTNRHVYEILIDKRVSAPTIQFDFTGTFEDGDGTGPEYELAAVVEGQQPAWLLGSSPVDQLDYALIRLPTGLGRKPLAAPAPYEFKAGDVYFIVQHPAGETMKIGGGTMIKSLATPPRVNYTTNTLGGSSGSPVFTTAWQPVALHRAGAKDRSFNSGVPLATIYDHAKAGGFWPAGAA